MPKNKSQRKNAKKSEQTNIASTEQHANASAFSKLSKQISVWIGLAASVAGVVGLLFTYVSIDEPDIRYLPNANPATAYFEGISRKDCDCFYYLSVKQPFKNTAIKGGYVNDIKFVNMSLDIVPSFELVDVDRVKLKWGEQQDVDVKFSVSFNSDDCRKLAQREKNFKFAVRYLDNTGKQILYDTEKIWAERTYDIDFSQPSVALAMSGK